MNENLFNRVIKGLEACIRKDCENCEYRKNFIHGCDRIIAEARELILERQHYLEFLQNLYDKREKDIWSGTYYDKY